MTIIVTFLAGVSFAIALAACLAVKQEQERARSCERALSSAMSEQAELVRIMAGKDYELEQLIRAVAAASVPPAIPVGQVHIVVPGPRTLQ